VSNELTSVAGLISFGFCVYNIVDIVCITNVK